VDWQSEICRSGAIRILAPVVLAQFQLNKYLPPPAPRIIVIESYPIYG
jgi:hypothetical protein